MVREDCWEHSPLLTHYPKAKSIDGKRGGKLFGKKKKSGLFNEKRG